MGRLLVRDIARDDVDEIARYIAQDNLDAALRFYDAAEVAFDLLAALPGAGPHIEPAIDLVPDLRFWPIKRYRNYLVLYRPLQDGVEVLRVVHGARDLPALFTAQ